MSRGFRMAAGGEGQPQAPVDAGGLGGIERKFGPAEIPQARRPLRFLGRETIDAVGEDASGQRFAEIPGPAFSGLLRIVVDLDPEIREAAA